MAIISTVIVLVAWCNRHFEHRISTVVTLAWWYNAKVIKVSGIVVGVARRADKGYTVFGLEDGSGGLTVIQSGPPTCREGTDVVVEGRFFSAAQVGGDEPMLYAERVLCQQSN